MRLRRYCLVFAAQTRTERDGERSSEKSGVLSRFLRIFAGVFHRFFTRPILVSKYNKMEAGERPETRISFHQGCSRFRKLETSFFICAARDASEVKAVVSGGCAGTTFGFLCRMQTDEQNNIFYFSLFIDIYVKMLGRDGERPHSFHTRTSYEFRLRLHHTATK